MCSMIIIEGVNVVDLERMKLFFFVLITCWCYIVFRKRLQMHLLSCYDDTLVWITWLRQLAPYCRTEHRSTECLKIYVKLTSYTSRYYVILICIKIDICQFVKGEACHCVDSKIIWRFFEILKLQSFIVRLTAQMKHSNCNRS